MPRRSTFQALHQAEKPTIACFNRATTPLGIDLDVLVAALQKYVDDHVAPVWGTPARLVRTIGYKKGAWAMVFLDNADKAGDLAYHDLTPEGLPQAKVFVKTIQKHGELLSVSASHELVEMLIDPAINLLTIGPSPKMLYAYESADPVEALSFKINGIPMCNFVFPAYFEHFHKPGSVQFDAMKKLRRPFQILSGGYQIVFKDGKWINLTVSRAKKKALANEDRRGHRSERREKKELKRANPASIKRTSG